jgi:diguanylate cyclase (GGDEF)-like protein
MQSEVMGSGASREVVTGVLDHLLDGIVVLDRAGRPLYRNAAADSLLGSPGAGPLARAARGLRHGTWVEIELPNLRFAEVSLVPITWQSAPARLFTLRDVTERRRAQASLAVLTDELRTANAHLQMLADVDPLTGLLNRRGLKRVLEAEITPRMRLGFDLVAIMIDCDRFKAVNDALGHLAGDAVLREVGRRLRSALRPGDAIARVGGDEFLVLLPGGRHPDALRVANRLREVVARSPVPLPHGSREVLLTVSVGVAQIPRHVKDPDEIVRRADARLRQSKAAGKNRVTGPAEVDAARGAPCR